MRKLKNLGGMYNGFLKEVKFAIEDTPSAVSLFILCPLSTSRIISKCHINPYSRLGSIK